MKRFFALLLVILAMLVITGCDMSSNDDDDDRSTGKTKRTEKSGQSTEASEDDELPESVVGGNSSTTVSSSTSEESVDIGITVMFSPNGGNIIDGSYYAKASGKRTVSSSDLPYVEREGYTLVGWAYDKGGVQMWAQTDTFTKNDVLYACWVSNDAPADTTDSSNWSETTDTSGFGDTTDTSILWGDTTDTSVSDDWWEGTIDTTGASAWWGSNAPIDSDIWWDDIITH